MNESRLEGDLARPVPRHERLAELLEQGAVGPLRDALNELHPAEAADWFESLPARDRDAGGVVLTTITDVVGFAAILGLGALALA